ncbi:MAG: LTA synthase family protein [Burkholderiaceae bacterium]|nr:LTA synthase family protein [Burkholderiaceae bacterium]
MAIFALLLAVWTTTRIVLVALAWPDLDAKPFRLLPVFGRGFATDALLALSVACALLALRALTHAGPRRGALSRATRAARLSIAASAIAFVAVAEVLFWDEFSTRFNFIAVDYLVYTTEVVGNIRESYPLGRLLGGVAAAGVAAAWLLARWRPVRLQPAWPVGGRLAVSLIAIVVAVLAGRLAIGVNDASASAPSLRVDVRAQELARNGLASFVAALRDNELSFRRFYATIDDARALRLAGPWPRPQPAPAFERVAARPAPAVPRHVVVIQVESLSADYLGVFGNPHGLTPHLDRLAREGISFTQLYATGTRTVRGLEALSIGLPPMPGQSIVRRPDNAGLQTLGGVLREHGFEATFLYGGYGYFDNMNAYFAANGYRVRDRSDIPGERIGFANIWGIADEYLFDDALEQMDRATRRGRRQLLHLMTTSNHRPYSYPDGRIDIASKTGRAGAVKYTDWAIGRFLEAARSRPWFAETLFLVVADHCGSVAGKTRIPPQRYRIPAILYWPGHLAPREIAALSSQIDLPPTITALLGVDEGGRFFGQDRLVAYPQERAFLGNYQEVGLLTPGERGERDLVVLSPRRHVEQYRIARDGSQRAVAVDPEKAEQTVAQYQFADTLLRTGRYRLTPAVRLPPQ